VFGLIVFLINNYLPLDPPIKMVINVVVVLVLILFLLSFIGVIPMGSVRLN
jgi:hypothetical protein